MKGDLVANFGLVQIPDTSTGESGGHGVLPPRIRGVWLFSPLWERQYLCVGRCVEGGECTCFLIMMNMTHERLFRGTVNGLEGMLPCTMS